MPVYWYENAICPFVQLIAEEKEMWALADKDGDNKLDLGEFEVGRFDCWIESL